MRCRTGSETSFHADHPLKPASTRKVRAAPTAAPRRDFDLPSLGGRIRAERERRGLSLDALSAKARVSRSMLSTIERGAKAPTVLVLDRVATGLNTSLARLLGEERRATLIVLRHRDQKVARDRSGWERRILSPVLPRVEFEFMRHWGRASMPVCFYHTRTGRGSTWPLNQARCNSPSTTGPISSRPAIASILTVTACMHLQILLTFRACTISPWMSLEIQRGPNIVASPITSINRPVASRHR
jgi:transcriptional regulator with XRE-family HTH domain